MKILIFGCGVIGGVYAVYLSEAGYLVSIYSRGNRLLEIKEKGLLYQKDNKVKKSMITVADRLDGKYDYVFVTVKNEQIEEALKEVKDIDCNNIVTMVNNPDGYEMWEKLLGKGRLIPAFAGAGGVIENGVLKARLTPAIIQKTTFGEIDGSRTYRIKELHKIFIRSSIPSAICNHMMDWQLCHLGLVLPLADAIYYGGGDNIDAGSDRTIMHHTAKKIRKNIKLLKQLGGSVEPLKMNIFILAPPTIVAFVLSKLFCSKFGAIFIYGHASKAKEEIIKLQHDYYMILKKRRK